MSVPEAYDQARKEFYAIRRRQQIQARVAAEEAENCGADFGVPFISRGMTKEAEVFDDWVVWAEKENMALMQRQASFAGQQPAPESAALQANSAARGAAAGREWTGTGFRGGAASTRMSSQVGESLSDATSRFLARQKQQRPVM